MVGYWTSITVSANSGSQEINEYDVPLIALAGVQLQVGYFGMNQSEDQFLHRSANNHSLNLVAENCC